MCAREICRFGNFRASFESKLEHETAARSGAFVLELCLLDRIQSSSVFGAPGDTTMKLVAAE